MGGEAQTRCIRACARSRVSIDKATSFTVIKVLIFRDVVYMQDLWITQKISYYAYTHRLRNYASLRSLRSLRRNPIFYADITQNYAKKSITHSTPMGGACPPHGS